MCIELTDFKSVEFAWKRWA